MPSGITPSIDRLMKNNITPELIRSALHFISAKLPRDEWARVGMAIKSEFPNSAGCNLFTDWSSTDEGYDPKATRSTWQSIKAGGGVGIGTLLHLAKQNGYNLPKSVQAPSTPDPEIAARLARERAERQQAEQATRQAAHAHAANEAALLWEQASETGESPYLTRKGVHPYGVRFTSDGWLLVPMRDEAGKLWNMQRIAPAKHVDGGPDKFFLKGGRKSGLYHVLGSVASDLARPAVVLVAEGYATAASLHEATGRPVIVAFDAGNMAHVVKLLRKQYTTALLVICGDDDAQNLSRTGNNPGRDKASAAARSVQGLSVFPSPLSDGGSDFNDLHQGAGLEAVCCIVEAAIDVHQASQTVAHAAQLDTESGASQNKRSKPSGADDAGGDRAHDPFTVSASGVGFTGADQDGKRKPPEWICSPLKVEAFTRDQDGNGWGYYLVFDDPLGNEKRWAMPARMLSADGGEYRAILLNMGLRIATTPRSRNLLTYFIQTRTPEEFASCTDRIGWHGLAFVLPRETIGDHAERIVFQSDNAVENTFKVKGTAERWRDGPGALCVGNSRLSFAVASAFAGPLLRPAGMESGGFHFRGNSSSGKTTALKLAASVNGGANYLQRWRATDNALEAIAAQHSDCLLILDELAQIDPKTAGECAYMLANEQGKARATRAGTPRTRQSWRVLFLSAGEVGLADHMAEGQKRARTGQEVRMADIPADAGAGLGAFENLHGYASGAAFSKRITDLAQAMYGAPGRAWLEWLTTNADTIKGSIRAKSNALAAQMIPKDSSGQVERVGARFALVGAAGEMATAAGLTGWPVGESERAATACFNAWLAARGGNGNGEVVAMLRAVRRFLEAHGEGRFSMWHRSADDHAPKTLQRAGVRRMLNADGKPIKTNNHHAIEFGDKMPATLGEDVSFEYFILAETFRAEVCQGFDYQAVCRVLLDHGCLSPDKGRPFDCRPRLPGVGPATCYRITPAIFDLEC
ncbi:Toprim domain-containing protein [Candidatus Nitrotoga arctica]|uniref:Toprim domain-containing protein n=2 Tax=Candidatus Nitrotoga arctica TaxID=453162 RepID=A0ABN8ALG8_9PROT|nr:Toprim domain-containing protein [Candidatus Nitrotoga arctica]